jgi:NTE family protein
MNRRDPHQTGSEGTGRTAFVLSGGGSLGAVQVGMLQGLTENGILPDILIGTSVGAVNAAWIAGKPDHGGSQQLAEIWQVLRRQDVFPFSPWNGARGLIGRSNHMISSGNLRPLLERHLPYQRLEEAAVPLHIVTTDLKTGRPHSICSGPAVPRCWPARQFPACFRQ